VENLVFLCTITRIIWTLRIFFIYRMARTEQTHKGVMAAVVKKPVLVRTDQQMRMDARIVEALTRPAAATTHPVVIDLVADTVVSPSVLVVPTPEEMRALESFAATTPERVELKNSCPPPRPVKKARLLDASEEHAYRLVAQEKARRDAAVEMPVVAPVSQLEMSTYRMTHPMEDPKEHLDQATKMMTGVYQHLVNHYSLQMTVKHARLVVENELFAVAGMVIRMNKRGCDSSARAPGFNPV